MTMWTEKQVSVPKKLVDLAKLILYQKYLGINF